jgi:hypothetical protein
MQKRKLGQGLEVSASRLVAWATASRVRVPTAQR